MDLPEIVTDRDFRGYGGNPPAVRWPGDARLAVSVVVNVEEGGEFSVSMGDPYNESAHEEVLETVGARDFNMETHFEYGTRQGWARIRKALKDRGVKATMNCVGRSILLSPWLVQEARADGHGFQCHGWLWEKHTHFEPDHERKMIAWNHEAVLRTAGIAPHGWHTRFGSSPNTPRLLVEHGDFFYHSDAFNDDIPYIDDRFGRPVVVLPYAFDTNDARFYLRYGMLTGDDFARYCIELPRVCRRLQLLRMWSHDEQDDEQVLG